MADGKDAGRPLTLDELQTELRSAHDGIREQLARVKAMSHAFGEGLSAADYLRRIEPVEPERMVADDLRQVDGELSLDEYLSQLHRLAEVTPEDLRDEWKRHRYRHLQDVSRTLSRDVSRFGDLLETACSGASFSGVAALFRGVHRTSASCVFVAECLEAYMDEKIGHVADT